MFKDDRNTRYNQLASRHEQEQAPAYLHQRDVHTTQVAIEEDNNATIQSKRHISARYQKRAHIHTPSHPPTAIQPAMVAFRDDPMLYVPGHGARREDDLQYMTDVMTTVIERPCFACDECDKDFKTRSDLR